MEQEKQEQPRKKSKAALPALVLAGALGLATIGGVGLGLASCKNSITGPGGTEEEEQHQHNWGNPVWSGEATWVYYDGSTSRKGPYPQAKYKPATAEQEGLGYRIGTESGTQTCTIDGTVKNVTRTYTPGQAETAWLFLDDISIPANKVLNADGTISDLGQTVDPGNPDPGNPDPGNPTPSGNLPTYSGSVQNVDVIGLLGAYGNGNASITNYDANTAYYAADGILTASQWNAGSPPNTLSSQAGALYTFFGTAATNMPALATKFGALKSAEAAIKNKANQTNGLPSYFTTVDAQQNAILTQIFGASAAGNDRETFDKYFNAYSTGQYLLQADWATRAGGAVTAKENEFKTYRDVLTNAGLIPATIEGGITPRSTPLQIGTGSSVDAQFGAMETAMKNQIISALNLSGLTGANAANAGKMAEALVIQLGQDLEGFRAFVDDITACGLTEAINYDYSVSGYSPVAAVSPQSNVKLAGINPENAFDPAGAIKGAYGSEYTSSFTPYKKEDNGIV